MEAVAAEVLSAIPLDEPAANGMPPLRISDPEVEAPLPETRIGVPGGRGKATRGRGDRTCGRGTRQLGAVSVLPDEPADARDESRGALELALPPVLRNLVRGLDGADTGADTGTGAGTGAPGENPQTGAHPTPPERATRFFFTGPREARFVDDTTC